MRVDFCLFTDEYGNAVYINPLTVRCIRGYGDNQSLLYFDEHHYVTVSVPPADAARGLTVE